MQEYAQASLTDLPDELFLKVILELVAGHTEGCTVTRKATGAPAGETPVLYASKDNVPSLWALMNTCKDLREAFARCIRHCQTHIAITYSPEVLHLHRTSNSQDSDELLKTQWRHRCKPVIPAS